MSKTTTINDWLAHAKRDLNLSANVYCQIASAPKDEQSELLEHYLIGIQKTETDATKSLPTLIPNDKLDDLKDKYKEKSEKFFLRLRQQNPTVPDFYNKLWIYISSSPELPTTIARVFVLHNMAVDQRIFYHQIGWDKLVSMENDKFREYNSMLDNMGISKKLEYILEYPLKQKTERASLIINLLNSLTSSELKAVLFAKVVTYYQRQSMDAILSGFGDD